MEFFYQANSCAAPFCSDTSTGFVTACDEDEAIEKAVQNYSHPYGLYALAIWKNANDFHKGKNSLKVWLSPQAMKDKKKRE